MKRMPSWSQIIEARTFLANFCTRNLWGGVKGYAATPLIVALYPGHSDITRFPPWSPIAPDRKSFGSRRKNPKFAQTTDTPDVSDPRSGISGHTSRRASACPTLTWDAQLLSYWLSRNPTFFQDYFVNLINNLQGGHCFGLSRTKRITGEKITTFKLDHRVFDGGIRWCMFL